MAAPRNLDGLIAWTRRPEWHERLTRCLDLHTAKACNTAGIDPAEIEDLLATDLPDGGNLAEEYLRRRGWTESTATREFIARHRPSGAGVRRCRGCRDPGRAAHP